MSGEWRAEIEALSGDALAAELCSIELIERALAARKASVISRVERSFEYETDGHASVTAWVRATLNCSPAVATRQVGLARLLHDEPSLGDALHEGCVGVSQMSEVVRVHGNPRVRDRVGELVPTLLSPAVLGLPFRDFKTCVDRFVLLADPDGAARDADDAYRNRHAAVTHLHDGVFVSAQGSGPAAVEMIAIFERFRSAEFLADWEHTVAEHGPAACKSLMPRTDDQRRFDALHAIFRAAACARVEGRAPEPLVSIIVDQTTFEDHLTALLTGAPVPQRAASELFTQARCETESGTPIHPADVVAAALIGRIRRVVYDSGGMVIDLGRARRLFTGSARDAVNLQARRCIWPGCQIDLARCQADHLQTWAEGGPTAPPNGAPTCPRHNRFRNHGHTVHRDHHGHWHTHRPDGTEIAPTQLQPTSV